MKFWVTLFTLSAVILFTESGFCGDNTALATDAMDYGMIHVKSLPPLPVMITHGYVELTFQIKNDDPLSAHRVTLSNPLSSKTPPYRKTPFITFKKTVRVPPRTTVDVTLYQPGFTLIDWYFEVIIDGKRMSKCLRLKNANWGSNELWYGWGRTSLNALVSTKGPDNLQSYYEMKLQPLLDILKKEKGNSWMGELDIQFNYSSLSVDYWPDSWLAYSSYDVVIMTSDELAHASGQIKIAIGDYIFSGGVLFLLGDTRPIADWTHTIRRENWGAYSTFGFGTILSTAARSPDQWSKKLLIETLKKLDNNARLFYRQRKLATLLKELPIDRYFYHRARWFIGLIILFAVILLPLHIVVLIMKNLRSLVYLTIPLLSIGISLLLVMVVWSYDGFGLENRMLLRTITILDQRINRNATLGYVGFYQAIPRVRRLQFDSDSLLWFQGLDMRPAIQLDFDWSYQQYLSGSCISPGIPTYILVRRVKTEHRKMVFNENTTAPPSVINGFGVPSKTVVYRTEQGIYLAQNVGPGEMKQMSLLKTGEGLTPAVHSNQFNVFLRVQSLEKVVTSKTIESYSQQLLNPGMYLAYFESSPFFPEPLSPVESKERSSIVLGIVKRGPINTINR